MTDSGNAWNYLRIALDAGSNTIRWVGRRDSGRDIFSSRLCLDVIEFPPQTLFDNALLSVDSVEITITLAPGEIRQIPLRLASPDGKYIRYTAIIRKADPDAAKNGAVWLSGNKSTFQPGTEELFFLTLHNSSPAQSVRELRVILPDGVLATLASSFNLPGHPPLPFYGTLGSPTGLCWSNPEGTDADSLTAGVRLLTDAGLSVLTLPCQIRAQDDAGNPLTYADTLEFASSDSLGSCLSVLPLEGEFQNREEATLILTANQNLLGTVQELYTLAVYSNGNHSLSIPIRIEYDPDPPGFYDTPRLCNYPNPFQLGTTFAYAVPADGRTVLTIYNLRGQKVRTLVAHDLAKGYYRTLWDMLDDRGRIVGSGIYFCRLSTSGGPGATIRCVVQK